MGEPQKSTVSPTQNHNISFPTSENFSITNTKHCVTLNLELDGNNKNAYSGKWFSSTIFFLFHSFYMAADQTPTPTRFIRNCEEVGLFQDLQNVNPFDETFKKAVELAKTGTLHVPDTSTDDTLHTPHILPHEQDPNAFKQTDNQQQCIFGISRVPSLDDDLLKLGGSKEHVGVGILDKLYERNKNGEESIDSTFSISRVPSIDEDLLIIANDDSNLERETFSSQKNKKENKETSEQKDANKALKMKIKETVQSRLRNENQALKLFDSGQGFIIAPVSIEKIRNAESATLLINQRPNPSIIKAPRKRAANPPSEFAKKSKNNEEVSLEKEKVRAMNRAAQSRSRIRKKNWINEMQKRMQDLTRENRKVLALNEQLKNELSLVRSILQYHSDCSATKDPDTSS